MGSIVYPPGELIIPRTAFTPTVSCATPGDLSVAIGSSLCFWSKKGDQVRLAVNLTFTPTYTTAAGQFQLGNLPFPADDIAVLTPIPFQSGTAFTWPNNGSQLALAPVASATYAVIQGTKTASGVTNMNMTLFPSGTVSTIRFRGSYTSVS